MQIMVNKNHVYLEYAFMICVTLEMGFHFTDTQELCCLIW